MLRPIAIASAVALLAGCGIGGPTYPKFGEASYRIEGNAAASDGSAPAHTVIYRDARKMRVETVLATGPANIVYDELSGAAYIVTAATTTAVAPAAASAPTTPAPVATGAKTTTTTSTTTTTPVTQPPPPAPPAVISAVAGTAVRLPDADAPKPMEEAWVTLGADGARSTGKCTVAGEDGALWTPRERAQGEPRTACITSDGIVLEIKEGPRVLWQATAVQRGAQDPALFGVPAGYQVIDPQAVAEKVGETMQDLSKVAGDPKAPPSTTPAPVSPKT